MRLMECVRLRIKDINFTRGPITVRSGNGDKHRVTVLPEALRDQLQSHIERLKGLYAEVRERNLHGVELPHASAVKSPNAGIACAWPAAPVRATIRHKFSDHRRAIHVGIWIMSTPFQFRDQHGAAMLAGIVHF